jgi:hypothetical protein
MTRQHPLLSVITLLLFACSAWAAEEQKAPSGDQASNGQVYSDIASRTDGDPVLLNQSSGYAETDARLGWWAMWNKGSPAKTGEYQDLKPSPFWDLDGLSSDGRQTLNYYGTGTDNESSKAGLNYYRGDFRANVDYERFIHRLDHDPLSNMPDTDAALTSIYPRVMKSDLNVGQDYVMRVQELNASFKGKLSDNLKARLDVWGMQKDGTRQANAIAMCYNQRASDPKPPDHLGPNGGPLGTMGNARCHVLSQQQQICWTTSEIKPVIEYRLGDSLNIEYSRPMRNFSSADQTVTRFYTRTGVETYNPTNNPNPYSNSDVPSSYTQMDQLKISGDITENTKAYAFMMAGNTYNTDNQMKRWFNDMDMRLTNNSLENVTVTGYGKIFNEDESAPDVATITSLNQPVGGVPSGKPLAPTQANVSAILDHPIDYRKSTAGMRSVWRPGGRGYGLGGLAITSGYEYCDLEREYAVYDLSNNGVIDQSHTITNSFQIGPDMRWSPSLDTFIKYKFQNAAQPLLGLESYNSLTNTLLPQIDHIVEIGFNWFPSDKFIFNASVGIERGETHGTFGNSANPINFDQENYPMSFTAWYAATNRLSLSAGYAVYSNFVAQDIWLADEKPGLAPVSSRWNYGGQAHVVTFGSRYAATERVTLTGQVEWVRGNDSINNSSMTFPGNVTVTDLGSYSQVTNETTRVTLGVDWAIRPRIVNYYRYELYNFLDKAPGYQTGTAQGILGGLSALF